jgi:hypothetical protein
MAKVKSIEEFQIEFAPRAKKAVKDFNQILFDRLEAIKDAEPEDYSEIVKAKLEKDGVSYSALKRFRETPMSYIDYLTSPRTPDTEATLLGKVVDILVTEPAKFEEKFFIMPEEVSRRSNEGKGLYLAYLDLAGNKSMIDNVMFDKAVQMAEALLKNSDSKFYLTNTTHFQEWVTFTHRETGIKCRGILDGRSEKEPKDFPFFLMDLKTTRSADPEKYSRDAFNLWYNGQFALYTMAFKYNNWLFPEFIHVCVESSAPYNVNVFRVDPDTIKEAQEELHNTLMAFKYCLDNNFWHKSYNFLRDDVLKYDTLKKPFYYKPKF